MVIKICLLALTLSAAATGRAAVVERAALSGGGAYPASFAAIPPLNAAYKAPEIRGLTVAILGSSKGTEAIQQHVEMAAKVSSQLVQRGYNVLTGNGNAGIMGAAYSGAVEGGKSAERAGTPHGENLTIVVSPAWGDENLKDGRAIGIADSEAARLEKFHQVSDHFLVFPGGASTLQEASALIAKNHYRGSAPAKRIFLVGTDFFQGLREQYDRLYAAGLLKTAPADLFQTVDSADEILAHFPAAR